MSQNNSNSPQTWRAAPLSRYQHPRTITTITRPTIAMHQIIHRQRTAPTMGRVITTIHHITILITYSRHRSTITTIRTQYSTIASRQYRRLKTRSMRRQSEQLLVSLHVNCFRLLLERGWNEWKLKICLNRYKNQSENSSRTRNVHVINAFKHARNEAQCVVGFNWSIDVALSCRWAKRHRFVCTFMGDQLHQLTTHVSENSLAHHAFD